MLLGSGWRAKEAYAVTNSYLETFKHAWTENFFLNFSTLTFQLVLWQFCLYFNISARTLIFWLTLSHFSLGFTDLDCVLPFKLAFHHFSSRFTVSAFQLFQLFHHPNFLRFFSKSDSSLLCYIQLKAIQNLSSEMIYEVAFRSGCLN